MESIAYLIYALVLLAISLALLVAWVFSRKHVFGLLLALLWAWYYFNRHKTYGDFWLEFEPEKLVAETSDGAKYAAKFGWRAEHDGYFRFTVVNAFAASNQWMLVDSISGSIDSLAITVDQRSNCEKGLHYRSFQNQVLNLLGPGKHRVFFYRCPEKALSINCGDLSAITGFVVFSEKDRLLRVFHYWGEI